MEGTKLDKVQQIDFGDNGGGRKSEYLMGFEPFKHLNTGVITDAMISTCSNDR